MEDYSKNISLALLNSAHCSSRRSLVSSVDRRSMSGNAQRETLESWKQIAAYLNRSERTVRRWESSEGLPVHRHGHQKQDTVFAHVDEINRWVGRRTRKSVPTAPVGTSESAGPADSEVPTDRKSTRLNSS